MGQPGAIWRPRSRMASAWVLLAVLLASAGADEDSLHLDSGSVPPSVLDSLRSAVFDGHVSRGARHVPPTDAEVPWYSPSTHGADDSAAREELKVTSVVKDDKFNFGVGVKKWHSLAVGSTTYLVGVGSPSVTLITAEFVAPDIGSGLIYSLSERTIDVGGNVSVALFKHWNAATKTLEAILVVSSDLEAGHLNWYRISNSGLDLIRTWPILNSVTYLKVFRVRDHLKLLMLTSCKSRLELVPCKSSADLYDFTLEGHLDPKLSQTLTLEEDAVSAEVGEVGDELYLALALPEANIAKLYRYKWPSPSEAGTGNHSIHGWFSFWKDLHSPRVTHAVFFHVSFKMYLAVGGEMPAVFRFVGPTRIEGCPKALQNVGFVSQWLVLPILTYRDEVVLLAEVRVDSAPFKGVVTLTWASAGVFNLQHQPHCIMGGKVSAVGGATCIIAESESALEGAVAVQLGDTSVVSVLVPKGAQPSSLYRIYVELQPVVNPLLLEVMRLREAQYNLKDQLHWQALEMAETEQLLLETLSSNGPNVVTTNWVIQEVETPEYVGDQPPLSTSGWAAEHSTVTIQELEELLAELKTLTRALQDSLVDAAVPMNGELHLLNYQTLLGGVEVRNHTHFQSLSVGFLNKESVQTLLKDVVRIDKAKRIGGTKIISDLNIVNVDFNTINGVSKDDLVFNVPGEAVRIDGNLEITQILHVNGNVDLPAHGTVGGLDFSEEIFVPGKEFQGMVRFDEITVEGDLTVDVINTVSMNPSNLRSMVSGGQSWKNSPFYDSLEVGGQLQVERINGFLWNDIVKRIVWKNLPQRIDGLTDVQGTLRSKSIDMLHLSGLDFPNDFVLKTRESQLITGSKTIQNNLFVGSMDIFNSVDSVPVDAFVTLTTDQNLHGKLKLKEADIKGDVKVDSVNGIVLNQMHNNSPLLGEDALVSSNVVLANLEVLGPIEISTTLDARNFKQDLLSIAVFPPHSNQTVLRGKKIVQGNLRVDGEGITIRSEMVNKRRIADIARLDTIQKFSGEKTVQRAFFETIQLTGRWDGVKVEDLNAEAVRLTGIQETNAHLNFTEPSELFASQMILEQINTFGPEVLNQPDSVCDASSVADRCVLKGSVSADAIRVAGNVVVDGKVCEWKLLDFENRRMSRSRPQTVVGDFSFGNINVTSHIVVSTLNNLPIAQLVKPKVPLVTSYKELEKLLLSGGFAVDELFVRGNIFTKNGVNGLDLTVFAQNAVKLNGDNKIFGSLAFEDVLTISSLDVTGSINRLNLSFLIEDSILKDEHRPIAVSGEKIFEAGFIVEGNIATSHLNGLDPMKIITKSSPATIKGPLKVLGSVFATNVNVTGLLNSIPISAFLNRYKLLSEGRHLLQGNVHFRAGVAVDDLFVRNSVNQVELEQFFKSVVMKNEPSRIPATKLFINAVVFKDVGVKGLVNQMALRDLARDVVIINDDNPVTVHGRVTFTKDLTAPAGISLSGSLNAAELDGCLLQEWLDNAIYLHKQMTISGFKKFSSVRSNSDLTLSTLNAVDLSKVITLRTPQDIPVKVNILSAALSHNLIVNGDVNGKTLQHEFDNTFMTTGNQIVTGSKSFLNGVVVQHNVLTNDYISGRNITNVVTLAGDQLINSPLKFLNMVVGGDLKVTKHISNIDVQRWQHKAFLKKSPLPQRVTGTWDVQRQVRFMDNVAGRGLLDGENVNALVEKVYQTKEWTKAMQADVKNDWIHLCHDTDALLERARAQPFLFQQVEVVQAISSSQPIASMHAFEALNEQFLAVSYSDLCSGAMYRWNGQKTAWDLLDGAVQNIGSVEKWATLQNSGATYLVTSAASGQNCPYQGGNVWRFEPSIKLRNVKNLDPWHDAAVDQEAGLLHLLGRSRINTYSLEEHDVKLVHNKTLPESDRSQFVPRSAGLGLSISDGEFVTVLEGAGGNTSLAQVSRSANSNLPARSNGNIVTMKIADGRKLVAATAEGSDLLVVYEDVASGHSLARVQVHGAHSLTVLELTAPGRNGQTLLAFIENEKQLRVVQYKGVEGFVDVTEAKLAVSIKEMVPVRLFTRGLVNKRHFLLLRSDHQVLLLEVEMSGDPLDKSPLNCNLV